MLTNDIVRKRKFKGLSNQSIKATASDSIFNPRQGGFNCPKIWVEFNESCFKSARMGFNLRKIVNLCITFEIKSRPFYAGNGFTLRNYLFDAVNLTKKWWY